MSSNDHTRGASTDLYRFDIQGSTVAGVYELDDGFWKSERLEAGESYALDGAYVVKTERDHGYLETTRYADPEGDGTYVKVAQGGTPAVPVATGMSSPANPSPSPTASGPAGVVYGGDGYTFGITAGVITQVTEYEHGRAQLQRIDANETYALEGADVIKTEFKAYGQEVTRYVDPEGDGLFVKFSEQWVGSSQAVGVAGVPVTAQLLLDRGRDGDDFVAVRGTQTAATGGLGADTFVVREMGHVTIGDFHQGQHDRLVFDMGQGVTSMQALLGLVSDVHWQADDLVIGLGEQASVTLVGVRIHGIGLEDIDVLS